jgi:hypothetical protein
MVTCDELIGTTETTRGVVQTDVIITGLDCIFMPADGPWEGPKHVALLIEAIKSRYVRRQHI